MTGLLHPSPRSPVRICKGETAIVYVSRRQIAATLRYRYLPVGLFAFVEQEGAGDRRFARGASRLGAVLGADGENFSLAGESTMNGHGDRCRSRAGKIFVDDSREDA